MEGAAVVPRGAPEGARGVNAHSAVRATVVYAPRHAIGRAIARKFPPIMTYSAARGHRRPLTPRPRPSPSGESAPPKNRPVPHLAPRVAAAADRSDRE